jgi:hypothetical protein
MTVNGITIQVEWLCRRQSMAQPQKKYSEICYTFLSTDRRG